MKTYVGINAIKAQEMTRGDYNQLRGWQIPADEDPNDEGYLIKNCDETYTWQPKELFESTHAEFDSTKLSSTASGMMSNDYKERFKAEYQQLKIRYDGLINMCNNWDAGKLNFTPTCPRDIYTIQLNAMIKYLGVLKERAKYEGIEL